MDKAKRIVCHLLKANGARQAPYADFTLCGLPAAGASAYWPGDFLAGAGYEKWCPECKRLEKSA